MAVELDRTARDEALASLRRYADEELGLEMGHLAAESLLDYLLEELGPAIHNQAVRDVQARIQARLMEIDAEMHQVEFPYWARQRRGRR